MVENNKYDFLKKYEIKPPDFDFIPRNTFYRKKIGRYWKNKNGEWYRPGAKNSNEAVIYFLGDMMCQDKMVDAARTSDGYDFKYVFDFVKPLFEKADLVCGNLETTICDSAPFRNKKLCTETCYYNNAPIQYLEAVAYSGVDAVVTANNHDMDTGVRGLAETIDHTRNMGLIQTGTYYDDSEKFQIINVRGIRIALTAFTDTHNYLTQNFTKEGREKLLNSYSDELAENIYKEAKSKGADLVITYLHSGIEYSFNVSIKQKKISNQLAKIGYDAIMCSHPHVLQMYDEIVIGKRKVPVIYSLGNFVSNQMKLDRKLTIILKMKVVKHEEIKLECSYIPCRMINEINRKDYIVMPLCEGSKKYINDSNMQTALDRISSIVGEKLKMEENIYFADLNGNDICWKETVSDAEAICYEEKKKLQFQEYSKRVMKTNSNKQVETDGVLFYSCCSSDDEQTDDSAEKSYSVCGCKSSQFIVPIPLVFNDAKVTSIEEYAFSGNNSLVRLSVHNDSMIDKVPKGMCKDCVNFEIFRIFNNKHLRVIGEEAFSGCSGMGCMILNKGMEKIEKKAFYGCTELYSIRIGPNVKSIADDAFDNCPKLVFYGVNGSYAEKYAAKHNIPFICMDNIY